METQNQRRTEPARERRNFMSGTALAGLILVTVGALLLSREMGVPVPHWLISWPMILIVVGVYMGVKNGFRGVGWAFPLLIGMVFLVEDIVPEALDRRLLWPIMIMAVGALLLYNVARGGGRSRRRYNPWQGDAGIESNETLDATTIFGSVEKTVVSKNFKHGDLTVIFGGATLNLAQADLTGKAVLDVTQVFGGTEIVLPANWSLQSNVTSIFGGVEDNRSKEGADPNKVLVLDGTVIFGGIEIKSY